MASRAAAMAPAFSSTTTFAPFWAAVVAATRPPLPAPTTTMSASTVSTNSVGISGLSRQLVAAAAPVSAVFVPPSAAGVGAQPARPMAAKAPAAAAPVRNPRRERLVSIASS